PLAHNHRFTQHWEALKAATPTPIAIPEATAPAAVAGPGGILIAAPPRTFPGWLVSLPPGVFIFGLHEKGDRYYDRPCYEKIANVILQLFQVCRDVLVTGNPGGGKVSSSDRMTIAPRRRNVALTCA